MKKIKNSQSGLSVPILIILVVIIGAALLYNYKQPVAPEAPVVDENVIENDEIVTTGEPEEVTEVSDPTIGNKNPRIELLTSYLENSYSNEETVQIRFESADSDGSIEKVVVYANEKIVAEIPTRGVTEGAPLVVLGKSFDKAVENAVDLVDDEEDDDVDTYSFRGTGDWSGDTAQCGITSGYMVIAHSETMSYDVRMTTDFSEKEICYSGNSINYMNKYFFKWDEPEADEYTIYGVAYDDDGATKRSKSFDITVTK